MFIPEIRVLAYVNPEITPLVVNIYEQVMTWELAKTYISNFDKISAIFSKENIEKVMAEFKLASFVTETFVHVDSVSLYLNKGYRFKNAHMVEKETLVREGRMTLIKETCGYEMYSTSPYHVGQREFMHELYIAEFPFLSDYSFHGGNFCYSNWEEEIYVAVNEDLANEDNSVGNTLYVPVLALKNCDIDAIIRRHVSYQEDYYGNDVTRAKYKTKALAVPYSEGAEKFYQKIRDFHSNK